MTPREIKFTKEPLCVHCVHRRTPEVCRFTKHGSACGDRETIETCSGYEYKLWRKCKK